MDEDLPGYAWGPAADTGQKPLDLYRATSGTPSFDHAKRTPFAAIYTRSAASFGCDFCMINIVNRNDNGDEVHAANSRGMRF